MAQTNQQATNITERINVLYPVPNVDVNYGPYTSVHEAYTTLYNNEAIAIGLTVGIQPEGTNNIQEYWFNGGTDEAHLVVKLADEGVTSYNDLDNKPQINGVTLSGNKTTSDLKITTANYISGNTTSLIKNVTLEGDKLTFTVGSNQYSFRLTEWHEVADFYVLFCNLRNDNGTIKATVGSQEYTYNAMTNEELLRCAKREDGSSDTYGYSVKSESTKTPMTIGNTTVKCDYVIDSDTMASLNVNSIIIMYRTSESNLPTLNVVCYNGSLDDGYWWYNNQADGTAYKNYLDRNNIINDGISYSLIGFNIGFNSTLGDKYGIRFTK